MTRAHRGGVFQDITNDLLVTHRHNQLDASLLEIRQRINSHNIMLTRDFNIPNIDTSNNSITSAPFSPARKLLELLEKHSLQQVVRESVEKNVQNILHLVLTNNETIFQNLPVVPGISGHDMVTFDITCN